MIKIGKKVLCAALAATSVALSLTACSTEAQESSFDDPLPWRSSGTVYEKLDYDVAIYDTLKSAAEDKRVKIADGGLSFTLDDGSTGGNTTLDMRFSVTYDSDKNVAGNDAGCTDTIVSRSTFEPKSLNTATMYKEVTLDDRENAANLSYRISADYFGDRKAKFLYTKQDGAKERTMGLPADPRHDNETMFFVARAQGIKNGSSTYFKTVNLFDSFLRGEITEYGITVSGSSKRDLDLGDWVKDFGIEAVTDEETQEVSYPVSCVSASMTINDENHGPAYYVTYSLVPFKAGDKTHGKLPVRIEYSQYSGSNNYRHTVYTLRSCAFDRPLQA